MVTKRSRNVTHVREEAVDSEPWSPSASGRRMAIMEEAGETSYKLDAPSWDGLLPDVISVLVYLQEADGGVQALLCGDGGTLRLPRRKVGQVEGNSAVQTTGNASIKVTVSLYFSPQCPI